MLPVKRNLFPTVARFFDDDWNNLFDWSNREMMTSNLNLPAANIQENNDDYVVELAAPGLEKDKFKIELDKHLLSISYHTESETEENKEDQRFLKKEYNYSSFKRTFHLNKSVIDENSIEAKYENGVLKITIPKKEEAKPLPAKLIEIS